MAPQQKTVTPPTGPGDLAAHTAVKKLTVAPGWYTATIGDEWNFLTPSGGVLMTIAMRAMQAELNNSDFRPVSANTHFCSPVPAGPLEIRVEVLRHGRAAAQVRAQLSSTTMPGPGLEVSATFGRMRDGIDLIDTTPPVSPCTPEAAGEAAVRPLFRAEHPPHFFDNFETRLALGKPWWETDWEPGAARMARWFRYKTPQVGANGFLDPLAIPPIADTMPPALVQKLGPGRQSFHAPSLDLTIHFLEDTTSEWLLAHVHARRAYAGFATADAEIWDDQGRLVAYATQMMFLRAIPGEKS